MKSGLLALFDHGEIVLTILVNPDNPKETHVCVSIYGVPSPVLVVETDAILSIIMESQNGVEETK